MADHDPPADRPPGEVLTTADGGRRRPRRSELRAQRKRGRRRGRRRASSAEGTEPGSGPAVGAESDVAPAESTSPPRRRRRHTKARRRSVTRTRRRRSRLKVVLGVVVLAALVVAAIVVVTELLAPGLMDRARDLVTPTAEGPAPVAEEPDFTAATLVTVDEDAGRAANVVVLAHDGNADQATLLLVPVGTVAEVPGHGTFTVGEAHDFGDAPLVWVTIDNLLGARLDGAVELARSEWAEVFDVTGGFEVDVGVQLRDEASGAVRFEPGRHHLDGGQLADYLALWGEDEVELERLPRARQVIEGLLTAVAEDDTVLDQLFAPGGPLAGAPDPELVRELIVDAADAHARDRLATFTLPVSPLGGGAEDLYRVDDERVDQFVDDRFAAARPLEGAGTRLQVLNGVGTPAIGQEVAERLRPSGYRVVLTGNADTFDHDTTLIVVYEDSSEQREVARDIQELLGVGRIERSPASQTVVDVTIVVGSDFTP